jgi:hypothetical protein
MIYVITTQWPLRHVNFVVHTGNIRPNKYQATDIKVVKVLVQDGGE